MDIIYAVEDDDSIRQLYECALCQEFEIQTFEKPSQLLARLNEKLPDVILLDIMLEEMDGYALISLIKGNSKYSDIPVIMVSAKVEEIAKVKGLNRGADDYIAKPFGVLELIARIKALLRRRNHHKALAYSSLILDDDKHIVTIAGEEKALTLKEYNTLKLLLENFGNAIDRQTFLTKVWGEDFLGETRALDMQITALRGKLEGSGLTIVTVRGVGYKITE